MHEPDVVRHSMNPFPVDRMRFVADHARRHTDLSQRFALILSDHLVTISAELNRWDTCIGLRRNCSVTERAVHPQTLHLISQRVLVNTRACMDCVRERDRLLDLLIEP